MAEVTNVCRCCRGSLGEDTHLTLCAVCSPWNDAKELIRLSVPAWQNYMEQHQKPLLDDTLEWLNEKPVIISHLPYTEGWVRLLQFLLGNSHIPIITTSIDAHRDYNQYILIRNILAARGSRLFPNLESTTMNNLDENEICVKFNGHEVRTHGNAIIVDGCKIDRGPGTLLFMMMLEKRAESVALRFLNLLRHIEGTEEKNPNRYEKQCRTVLSDGRFNPYGAADAPRTKSNKSKNAPPPLCDWDHETYLLGIDLGTKGRHTIPLPTQPALLERFLTIWSGRPSTLISDRLRAAVRHVTKIIGTPSQDARISPLERSFSLYRSTIDSNPAVKVIDRGLVVTGRLGVSWRIAPGRGAHGAPYIIQTISDSGVILGMPICIFDNADLPLGDRLTSVVLGLLNDDKLKHQFPQIQEAVRYHNFQMKRMKEFNTVQG